MNNTAQFLIYLSMPLYLAQWYADRCERCRCDESEIYSPCVYAFDRDKPVGVQPVKGSFPSKILRKELDKQPEVVSIAIPEDTTIALIIPYYSIKPPQIYNYLSDKAKKILIQVIRDEYDAELAQFVSPYLGKRIPKNDLLDLWMSKHGMDLTNETVCIAVTQGFNRARDAHYPRTRNKKQS